MTETLFKHINIETKDVNTEDRTITAIGSKQIIDRDDDLIMVKGIDVKDYRKNPVVLFAHDNRGLPIGKAKKVWVSGDELKFKIEFATAEENPKAEYVYRLYKGGFMSSFSIGFRPDFEAIEYPEKKSNNKKKEPRRIFHKVSLLEVSCVPVPANQDALMASLNKAWDNGIIDGEELLELQNMCNDMKEEEVKVVDKPEVILLDEIVSNEPDPNTIKDLQAMINTLKKKLEDLETIKEIEVDDDDWLTKLFNEFEASGADERPDEDHINEYDNFDNYLHKLLGD